MLSSKLAEASLGISSPVPLQACWDCGVLIQSPGPQLQLLSDSPTAVGYVVSPTPVTLFGNSIFVDGNQVKLSHIGLGVLCTMTGVLIKEKRGDRHLGRTPWDDEGRDWRDAADTSPPGLALGVSFAPLSFSMYTAAAILHSPCEFGCFLDVPLKGNLHADKDSIYFAHFYTRCRPWGMAHVCHSENVCRLDG